MKKIILMLSLAAAAMYVSCKKNTDAHVPPDLSFATGGSYTSADRTIVHGDSILVGVRIVKKEDDLRTLNISYSYYGGSSITWAPGSHTMTTAEYGGYSGDFRIVTRNQAGTEKWIFTVTDRDGNLAQKSITLTVQ
jgi:hypothetical protein